MLSVLGMCIDVGALEETRVAEVLAAEEALRGVKLDKIETVVTL